MNEIKLSVESREERGSANARRLRATGKIPGTVYGMKTDPAAVTVDRAELRRALSTGAGMNALILLDVGAESYPTLVKDLQRHPVRRDPIHIDFQRIDPEQVMTLSVPVVLEGDAKEVTSNMGMVEQVLTHLLVSVRPDSIPNEIRHDISELQIDDVITVADLVLPRGVTTEVDPASPVVMGSLTRAALVTEEEEAALLAAEDGEVGEAGAEEGESEGDAADDGEASSSSDDG